MEELSALVEARLKLGQALSLFGGGPSAGVAVNNLDKILELKTQAFLEDLQPKKETSE